MSIHSTGGDELRTAQILANEIAQHLRWKQNLMSDPLMSSKWTDARQAQFERWEQNVCGKIEQWRWTAIDRHAEDAVDEILALQFLLLESETIRKFVQGLIGKPHLTPQR